MSLNKINKLSILVGLGIVVSTAAHADLRIHSSSPRGTDDLNTSVNQSDFEIKMKGIGHYIDKPIVGDISGLPLSVAISEILPDGWTAQYQNGIESDIVYWEQKGNWDEVLFNLSKNNGFLVTLDWDDKLITMNSGGVQMVDSSSPFTPNNAVTSAVDGLVYCTDSGDEMVINNDIDTEDGVISSGLSIRADSDACKSKNVDIEKLVFDTEWDEPELDADDANIAPDALVKSHNGDYIPDSIIDKRESQSAKDKERQLKHLYDTSFILPGNGSFEDFVNLGGDVGKYSPDSKNVYVYRRGKLFTSINAWADANGYVVKNDIFDLEGVDYTNVSEVRIGGTFKEATSLVLNKYMDAKIPVNHKYYVSGGSKVLHIFNTKYKIN